MTEPEAASVAEGARRRFDVELFIVHPTLDPDEITAELGPKPQNVHKVGERRTPASEKTNRDTRWRYSIRHDVEDQWFAAQVSELVDRLAPHGRFFRQLRSACGTASVIVQFLGDGYFGDEIPRSVLAKLFDLELDLAIECFQTPQS